MERNSVLKGLTKVMIANSSTGLSELLNDRKKKGLSVYEMRKEHYFIIYQKKEHPQPHSYLYPYAIHLPKIKIINSRAELCALLNNPKLDVLKLDKMGNKQLLITYYEKEELNYDKKDNCLSKQEELTSLKEELMKSRKLTNDMAIMMLTIIALYMILLLFSFAHYL
jgi:hypothetical protein